MAARVQERVMPTKRTPINRQAKARIPAIALDIFRRMRLCERRHDWDTWHDLNAQLHSAMKLRPWKFPALAHPAEPCPDYVAADDWSTMQARYRELKAALVAAKAKRDA
jgi:hypothetical protein